LQPGQAGGLGLVEVLFYGRLFGVVGRNVVTAFGLSRDLWVEDWKLDLVGVKFQRLLDGKIDLIGVSLTISS
jgi:hypothetical protein